MAKAVNFSVVMARDYYAQLLQLILSAKKRIVLAAMTVRAGPDSGRILRAITTAARRGVAVHVVADVFCQHAINRPNYLNRSGFRAECAETRELLNEIHALGGTVDWVGKMGLNPYAGRYHVKASVVDDHIFSFGGVNFCDDAFGNIDYMLYAKSASLANTLESLIISNGQGLPALDSEMPIDARNTILFDAGTRGVSVIYARACELAAKAAKITYISQMCPSGRLGTLIKQTQYTCHFNRPEQTGWRPDSLAQYWDNWRTGIVNHYESEQYLHAKCILYELKDGTTAAISGSHNFSWRGVAFGTKEIALCSTDKDVWRAMQDVVYAVATASQTR
jgi:phosphatidylserine/phosphatidylglycerophosphate/cardiolipin synthase-like enzyme